jgi:hypothetical protein
MASGIASESQAYQDLIAGDVVVVPRVLDSTATAAVGQVLKYDSTAHNWVDASNIAPDAAGVPLVVCAENKTLADDTPVLCIVRGLVNRTKLDSASQAFDDLDAALQISGIIARPGL